jgi:predicted methyltransferase
MSFPSRSTPRLFFLLLALPFLAAPLHSQDEWKIRDTWGKPQEVMDVLGIKAGSAVADVGAGEGYFTFRLAARVGPTGKVYAEDILDDRLDKIRTRATTQKLAQIETILGATDDPRLPAEQLDVVLVVNAYHEMREYDAMLRGMFRALKPGGLLGIIDAPAKTGEPRENYYDRHRIPEQLVREDTARNGFRFLRQRPAFTPPDSDRTYFFLIFQRPAAPASN